ncbi:MAG: DHH family phosphoesterase [Huintestinicola sp.]
MTGKPWKLFKLISMLLIVTALACAFAVAAYDEVKFWALLGIVACVALCYLALFMMSENNLHKFVSEMESQLNLTERDSLYKFPAPALIVDREGIIIWFNKAFVEQIHSSDAYGVHLSSIIDIDLEKTFDSLDTVVEYQAGSYRVSAVTTEKHDDDSNVVSELTLLYFQDITDLICAQKEYESSRIWVMMILVDSYEELFAKVKDSEKSHITMQIDKLMESFMEEHGGIIKKIASDRFFAVISEEELRKLMDDKFKDILEKAKSITTSDHTPVTVSIGVGRGGEDLPESEKMARQALDMTQGRGGDQVAIKDDSDYTFFGGTSKGLEKSTKVKTRIFSSNLQELINSSDKVIIMGHSWSDLDAVGAAAGLCGAIRAMSRESYICVKENATLAMPIITRLKENLEDGEDMFISEDTALEYLTERTLVVIVDVNNVDMLESKALYSAAKSVVFIDHHRQVVNSIENAVISLHEPYASSASEMVTEVIQYFTLDTPIPCYCADALLAGIMLDTKDFVMRTGVRTFEAAAFLKKLGADTVAVKRLFAISFSTGVKRSKIIESAEIYKRYAIASCTDTDGDIRVASSQAANELLSIENVDASFVIFTSGKGVNISARSLGAVNVQIIMEKMGGGGHQTMAAAQLDGCTVPEARKALIAALDEHIRSIS